MVLHGRNVGIFRVVLAVILTVIVATGAWAATLTGNVQNSSGKAGRVYLRASNNSFGTSFTIAAGQTLPFSIRGVTSNNMYTVDAFLDVTGLGVQHANDPTGISSSVQVTSDTTYNVGTITLANPSVPFSGEYSPLATPLAANGAVFLMLDSDFYYSEQYNREYPVAETFDVERATNGSANPAICASLTNITTVKTGIKNRDQGAWADSAGQATSCYRVTAHASGQASVTSSWMPVMPKQGSRSVSGTITINGVTPSGPLYVAVVDESGDQPKVAAAAISNPSSSQAFTITGVEDGTYFLFAFLDMNNSGTEDFGDVVLGEFNTPQVVVNGRNVTGVSATMTAVDSLASIMTNHWTGNSQWGYFDNYSLNFAIDGMRKKPVTVVVTSGPNIAVPIDIGLNDWGFSSWVFINSTRPTPGSQYNLDITYEGDSSPTPTTVTISTVLDAFATNLAPTGNIQFNQNQLFSWAAPSSPPASYTYTVQVSDATNYNQIWHIEDLPSTTTSVTYNQNNEAFGPLEPNKTYQWSVSVRDAAGNAAFRQTVFTPVTGPAINGFSPAGGNTGTTVYIDGLNFSTTPANNVVTFAGSMARATATVTNATVSRLTVTVPPGVTTGTIQVTSSGVGPVESTSNFSVGTAGSFSGLVVNSGSAPLGGVAVSLGGNPSVTTTSQVGTGSFSLGGLPANGTYDLVAEKTGYLPAVSAVINGGSAVTTTAPFLLFTQAEVNSWGVYAGKGVITARVVDQSGNPIGGAVASIQSGMGKTYTAYYSSDGITFGGTSTSANNGLIVVPNVEPNDWVTLGASKTGWTFYTTSFRVRPFAVGEGAVFGAPSMPSVSGISPQSGKAGSTVTITGSNFETTQSVTLAGQNAPFVVNSATQITVTVPAGASTGAFVVNTLGGDAGSGLFTVLQTLAVTTTGTGNGTVTSVSPDSRIACQSGSATNCSADFDKGMTVTLTATPDNSGSVFSGWSGACTASVGDCNVTMDADKAVTATFSVTPNLKLINGMTETTFASLADAYAAAVTGDTIMARTLDFTGPFNFNRNVALVFNGGYDASFTPTTGYTKLLGGLTVSLGSVTFSNVALQ